MTKDIETHITEVHAFLRNSEATISQLNSSIGHIPNNQIYQVRTAVLKIIWEYQSQSTQINALLTREMSDEMRSLLKIKEEEAGAKIRKYTKRLCNLEEE